MSIASALFGVAPDRDERASHVCAETLLTLAANGYEAPDSAEDLRSPKWERWAVRSFALSRNFLSERTSGRAAAEDLTPQRYGELLATGQEFLASTNLRLAKWAFEGLVDPSTDSGQPGSWLLFPFHESLLWYDARKQRARPWGVRKVYMRGSGITLARLISRPPAQQDRETGKAAVRAIKDALREDSPLARIAEHLEGPLSALYASEARTTTDDEREAWNTGGDQALAELGARLTRHCEGVMNQGSGSGPAKLWQLRAVLGLDFACHAMEASWNRLETEGPERFVALVFGGPPRSENRVRQTSEQSYRQARVAISEATIRTVAMNMRQIASEPSVNWIDEFEPRAVSGLRHVIDSLNTSAGAFDFELWAREAVEGADYDRTGQGFRVLLESIGMLGGTGRYRYLTASPDLLAAMVGALSAEMPMPSDQFFERAFQEWKMIIGPGQLAKTSLARRVDGADLARNQSRAESAMIEAGLALGLSDRTTMVGERARRGGL